MLKLYLISQDVNDGYDTYDAAVVCAENEDEARNTEVGSSDTWARPEHIKVQLIGKANKDFAKGIVLSSFNSS